MSGPGVLLATKLHVLRPPPGFVPRRVLVSAPAGFGKTALLADWARGDGRPVAWLGLDGDDSDPARFWRYAVAALDRARPGLAGRVGQLLPRSFEGLVTVWVPKTCSTSCDQVIFADQATDLSVFSDTVQVEIDKLG
jgi:LuxR family maltose regulon positive regulatory protein